MASSSAHHGLRVVFLFASLLLTVNYCSGGIDTSRVTLDATFYTILGCAADLYASPELIALYQLRIYPDEPTTWCVFRCLGQRLKTYDDTNGFNVDLQYERLKDSLTISEQQYKQGLRNCIQRVTEGRRLGICEKAYRILRGCQGDTIERAHQKELKELLVCGSLT
uniref:Putative odorant-binding protein agamobp12 n=1 Tax=Anopheles marajoara TaxID=58244 RepID=A0A2M4C678_9DIPT